MSSKGKKCQEPIPYTELLDENRSLKDEVQSMRARLEEADDFKRAIIEGDLEAIVFPKPEGKFDLYLGWRRSRISHLSGDDE